MFLYFILRLMCICTDFKLCFYLYLGSEADMQLKFQFKNKKIQTVILEDERPGLVSETTAVAFSLQRS